VAHATTSGYGAHATTLGGAAHAIATGTSSPATTSGVQSIACALGALSRARADTIGSWLVAAEWAYGEIVSIVSARVDGVTVLPGVWYRAEGGRLVEVKK
jgi:hypothetical protein